MGNYELFHYLEWFYGLYDIFGNGVWFVMIIGKVFDIVL